MNNTTSPRFLECLIGLVCQLSRVSQYNNYLIIEVDPETNELVLLNDGLNDGNIQRASVTEIWLTEKSRGELKDKIYNQRGQ